MSDENMVIYCVVNGTSDVFSVKIPSTDSVDDLKDHIKAKKTVDFNDIDADKLTLWRVSIPDSNDEQPILIENIPEVEKEKLRATIELSDVFKTGVPKNTIHILVQRRFPVMDLNAARDLEFNIVVKDESPVHIPWKTNPTTVTLDRLLTDLQVALPTLHRERRVIAIEHSECPSFPNAGVVYLSSNAQLQEILQAYLRAKLDTIVLHVVFVQKSFSLFTESDIKARLGTFDFPPMEIGRITCDNGDRLEALGKLMVAVGLARDSMSVLNEACTTRLSGPFFMAATTLFPSLDLVPEKSISGSWGTGRPDYLIESKNALELSMVGSAEAKKPLKFDSGFPQILAQLEATLIVRTEHDCRTNGQSTDLFSYGIVTDASRWLFVEVRMKGANAKGINHRLAVRRSLLPVTIDYKNDGDWKNQLQEVFEHVVWLFDKMSGSVISSKRSKPETREP